MLTVLLTLFVLGVVWLGLLALVAFGVYKAGSLATRHPDAAAGVGKFVAGLIKK